MKIKTKTKRISLIHPFSAKAIGLQEPDLLYYHSKPHENALKALKQKGYQVSITYFTGRCFIYSKTVNGVKKIFWPITYPIFKKRHFWRKQWSRIQLWYYKLQPPDISIINMSGNGSPFVFKLAHILNNKGKPYIPMIGGMHVSADNQAMDYYKKAEHIIVHTNVQRQNLKKLASFRDVDIEVIPLGIDTKMFKPATAPKGNNLLYVGRIARLKQVELAIQALHDVVSKGDNTVKLHIIGPISNQGYYLELLELIKKLNLENHVIIKGSMKQEDLLPYYQKAKLLLLPSQHESFGMVMVEAMACSTPVIALKGSGGPDELIESGKNGMLGTKQNFSEMVLQCFEDKELWNNLSNQARQTVINKWSLEYTISCFEKSIKRALD